jgi:hypothetical protein
VASIEVPGVVARESVMYRDDADGFLEKIEEVLRRKGVVEA